MALVLLPRDDVAGTTVSDTLQPPVPTGVTLPYAILAGNVAAEGGRFLPVLPLVAPAILFAAFEAATPLRSSLARAPLVTATLGSKVVPFLWRRVGSSFSAAVRNAFTAATVVVVAGSSYANVRPCSTQGSVAKSNGFNCSGGRGADDRNRSRESI